MNRMPIRRRAAAVTIHPGSELTADEVEFGLAMDEFQRRYRVRYPAWSDILFVLHTLGYRKAAQAEDGLTTEAQRHGENEERVDC